MSIKLRTPFIKIGFKDPSLEEQTPYAKTRQVINGPYTRIYLIRHCHPDYTLKEKLGDKQMPLSELGKKQRKLLNKKLEQIKLEKIYISELSDPKKQLRNLPKNTKKECI